MRKPTIKVYGLPRSGNNWLIHMLQANWHIDFLGSKRGGWTHGRVQVKRIWGSEPDAVLTITKHPYSWLVSDWRYEGKCRFPVYVTDKNPIARYNEMNWHWLDYWWDDAKTKHVRFEDLLASPESTLAEFMDGVADRRERGGFQAAKKKMNKHGSESTQSFDRSYYIKRKYMTLYSEQLLATVNSWVDTDLLRRLGYELENV